MQTKIVIGTIAFMLAMMVFGYSALREPARLERFTNAELGRSIEAGAEIYANNCATCHGVDGTAQECFDAAGNQIACQGLPLNYNGLLCGDVSQRMVDMGWNGTKADFILTTIAAGRGNVMPTWHEQFGGPLRNDQVQNAANFVLNFESEELCAAIYKLAVAAHEMELDVMSGVLRRETDGRWLIGDYDLVSWLDAHNGEEMVLVLGSLADERDLEVRTCGTCGRDYTDLECPYCRANRIRLRGHA